MTTIREARLERDQERRDAYDQRMAYLATPKGYAARQRARAKSAKAHAERLDRYAHGARGPMAHHHIPGGRIRRAAKLGQRARKAARVQRQERRAELQRRIAR